LDNVNFEGGTDDYFTVFTFTGQNDFLTPLDGWTFVNMDPDTGVTLQTVNSLGSTRFNGREITFRGPQASSGAAVIFNDWRSLGVIPAGATGGDYAGRLILPTAGQSLRLTNSGELATFVSYQYTFNVGAANETTNIAWYLKSYEGEPTILDTRIAIPSNNPTNTQFDSKNEWIKLYGFDPAVTTQTFDSLGSMLYNGHELTIRGTTGYTITFNDASVNNPTTDGKIYLPTTNLVLDASNKMVTFIYNLWDDAWYLKSKNF